MNEYILTYFSAEVKEFFKIPCQSNKNMIYSEYQGRKPWHEKGGR